MGAVGKIEGSYWQLPEQLDVQPRMLFSPPDSTLHTVIADIFHSLTPVPEHVRILPE